MTADVRAWLQALAPRLGPSRLARGTPLATGESHANYEVIYAPKLTGYATLDTESWTQNDGWGWTLTVEEA